MKQRVWSPPRLKPESTIFHRDEENVVELEEKGHNAKECDLEFVSGNMSRDYQENKFNGIERTSA